MTGLQARVVAFAGRIGLAGLVIALLAIALAIQTARIEGFHVWPVSMTGWKKTALDAQAGLVRIAKAQDDAAKAARQARIDQETTYREIAERIDDNATKSMDAALVAADRFIAAGGLRAQTAGSPPCSARTASTYHAAQDPDRTGPATQLDAASAGPRDAGTRAEDAVLVSAADVRICTANTVKAEAGRDLALQLEAASDAQAAADRIRSPQPD